ncbi:hypothetical protein DPMN_072998 [Dreissena polymorpha]|uniref:Uncharacterized protein n=1 Tax=Dreissena polymorpha TaxID=45954 RepID=A0A9D4BYC9_DREPO|nr:hypothetical protein DPMN_072998 [Dreissena polymorpha]
MGESTRLKWVKTNEFIDDDDDVYLRESGVHITRKSQSNQYPIKLYTCSHKMKNAPHHGSHVFQANVIIVELIQDINKTNPLTIFHEDWKINVAFRKNAPPPGSHVFQPTSIIFELTQDIIGMNLLTKKNSLPQGSHVFFSKDIIGTNLLSKFHEDRKINVASREKFPPPPPGGHVFQPTGIIFELIQDIIGRNLLTKKNAPPLGSHVFRANVTIFELIQDIIETNLLTKFHVDWTIKVASRELTKQMLTPHNAQRTKGNHKSSP